MSGVEFLGEATGGGLEDLDRALLNGHLLAQPFHLRELHSRRTDLEAATRRASLTQIRSISGDPIPRSRAASTIAQPLSNTSITARRRNSDEHFDGRALPTDSAPQPESHGIETAPNPGWLKQPRIAF